MTDPSNATVKIRNSAGALLLDLSEGGYTALTVSDAGRTWRRVVLTSPFVDGNHEAHACIDGFMFEVSILIQGGTWVEVEQRRKALEVAVSAFSWLIELSIEGVSSTYRADRPDIATPLSSENIANNNRIVNLRIPVQPTPAMTGI